jgi:glycerophosphoryl diester phosphodiesterase
VRQAFRVSKFAPAKSARKIRLRPRFRLKQRGGMTKCIKSFLAVAALGVVFTNSPMNAADSTLPAIELIEAKRPLVIAHRGYMQFAPENTLPSFKFAIEAGADLVELDYYHSKDNVPILFHDSTLDRTTDATRRWNERKIPVSSKTAAEIQSLDAGSWFHPMYAGTRMPLLTEALDFIQDGGVTLIERKEGDAATCIKILREKDLINKVVVQAFDWSYLRDFHEREPRQVLGALGPPKLLANGEKPPSIPKALSAAWLDELVKTGAKVAVWNKEVSRDAVQLAHQRGLKVWVYTVNDPELANKLLDMGVDGIITDNTSLIWRTLALRAMK